MNKTVYLVALLFIFETTHSMNLEEKTAKELIQKTNNQKYIFIDLTTLYQPNEKIAQEKITPKIKKPSNYSFSHLWSNVSLGINYFMSPESVSQEKKEALFNFLENLSIPQEDFTISTSMVHTYDRDGRKRKLSSVFSTFFLLKTKEKEQKLREYIKDELDKIDHESSIHKNILSASIDIMFDSSEINDIMQLNQTMYQIAQKLKSDGHRLILTGNIPTYAFIDFIKLEKATPLKELFEEKHFFISGKENCLTPQKKFYRNIFKTLEIDPQSCIIINEHTKNMQKASLLGAATLKFKHCDTEKKPIEDTLKKFNEKLELALIKEKINIDE